MQTRTAHRLDHQLLTNHTALLGSSHGSCLSVREITYYSPCMNNKFCTRWSLAHVSHLEGLIHC